MNLVPLAWLHDTRDNYSPHLLLQRGIPSSRCAFNSFHRFDRNPDTPIINALLEANSGNLSPFLETPAQFGLTPALVAIAAKNPDALVHLLDAGASLNPSPGMNLRELLVNKPPWGIIETGGEAVVEPIDAQRCLYIIQMHDPSLIRDNIPREMKSSAPLKAVMTSNVKPKRTKGVIISKIGRSIYNRFSRPNRESSTGTVVDNPLHAF